MNNFNTLPHKSNDPSSNHLNSNYPHAYLNANNARSNSLMHQNYNNPQPSYMANYNHYYQYQNQTMQPNFNYYQNPNFNMHQMPPTFYPNGNFQQNRQFNQRFNNGNAPYNRNNHGNSPHSNNKNTNKKAFNNNGNNQHKNKHQKQNSQKTVGSPEQDEFYCESCDRGFKIEEKYKEHCMTHKTVQ